MNIKKIGLSALAGSLVAFSANAGELSVSGSASMTLSDAGYKTTGNGWTMGDTLSFSGGGEMDNGMTVSFKYNLDGGTEEDHSMSISGDFGTLAFHGAGGSSALSAVDDTTPNAYEESWDIAGFSATDDGGTKIINGNAQPNMFAYTSPTVSGATATITYVNSSAAGSDVSSTEYAIAVSPEMVEGLTIGAAFAEDESTAGTAIDEEVMYFKYAYGPITFGHSISESDHPSNNNLDKDFSATGITYAVSDDVSIGYNVSTLETGSTSDKDQEASGISASYTTGGITISGAMNDVDNVGNEDSKDQEGFELNFALAF